MNHPVISSINAETRFNDFLKDAENHRLRKRMRGSGYSPLSFLTSFISALTGLLPKGQHEAASDKMAAEKS